MAIATRPGADSGIRMRTKRAQAGAAVDHGLLLQVRRNTSEVAHQQPRAERRREREIDDYQPVQGVAQVELGNHHREGDEEERGRRQIGEQDQPPEPRRNGTLAHQAVGRERRYEDRDQRPADATIRLLRC